VLGSNGEVLPASQDFCGCLDGQADARHLSTRYDSCADTRRCLLWGMVNSIGMIVAFATGMQLGSCWSGMRLRLGELRLRYMVFLLLLQVHPNKPTLVVKAVSVPAFCSLRGVGS